MFLANAKLIVNNNHNSLNEWMLDLSGNVVKSLRYTRAWTNCMGWVNSLISIDGAAEEAFEQY